MKRWMYAPMLFLLCAACTTTGEKGIPWTIRLKGVQGVEVTSAFYNDAKQHTTHYREVTLERKGEVQQYMGMPFYLVVAMADGSDQKHPYTFSRELWEKGYDITLTGRDGYTATFNTGDYSYKAFYLADRLNGKPVPPALVGDVPGNLWVKDLVEIELDLAAETKANETFVFTLEVNGKQSAYTLAELKNSPLYREDKGSYTTSAGTTYSNIYGGISIAGLLNRQIQLKPETTIRITAMDDYEMQYSGKEILDETNGTWILALTMDGEYLPYDPGYIRTIKTGPQNPNIDGHLSVRMVKKVSVEGTEYRDFTLAISGKMSFTLDRSTMQSGVNCHTKEVDFERKETKAKYRGIPLWRLLAYADDAGYAPHKQDSSIISYNKELAAAGYKIEITASDGYKLTLDSQALDGNDDVILAMYKDGGELPEGEWPLILVWDKNAKIVPEGIKPVKMIAKITLLF